MNEKTASRVGIAGGVLLAAAPILLFALGAKASRQARLLAAMRPGLDAAAAGAEQALAEQQSALELKVLDAGRLRDSLSGLAKSKVESFAASLSLQEEKRLLEKQQEILTTSLLLDSQAERVSLMRNGQAARGFPVAYAAPKAFGGIQGRAAGGRIVSKERFAHPQRSKFEEKNGGIQWEPQQEGSSLRSSALGEYVLFVQGNLILHGPSKLKADHDAYPHFCLGLTQETAKNLYNASFIGTRVVLPPPPKRAAVPSAPAAAAQEVGDPQAPAAK